MSDANSAIVVPLQIKERTYIGKMGNTGGSFGAHNHYGMSIVDDRCFRTNLKNGYAGWINPISFLQGK